MVGHLLDAEGNPIQGATVESLEARFTTDEKGHFAVSYKAPTQYVFVSRDGVWVERHYRPEDDKADVALRMPALASRMFACEVDEACEARLVWETEAGTKAIVRGKCDPEVMTVRFTASPGPLTSSRCSPLTSSTLAGSVLATTTPSRLTVMSAGSTARLSARLPSSDLSRWWSATQIGLSVASTGLWQRVTISSIFATEMTPGE
jgi:hypothetical protein